MLTTYFTITFRRTPTRFSTTESFTTTSPQDYLQQTEYNDKYIEMSPNGKKLLGLIGLGIVISEVYELTNTHKNIYYSDRERKCSNALIEILKPRIIEVMMD
jgi:hypothetical protein